MLLQLLIAGVLGALFTIKMYWYRFKRFFGGHFDAFGRCFGRSVIGAAASSERQSCAVVRTNQDFWENFVKIRNKEDK